MDSKKFKVFLIGGLILFIGLVIGIIILSMPKKAEELMTTDAPESVTIVASTDSSSEAETAIDTEALTDTETTEDTETATGTEADTAEESEKAGTAILSDSNTQEEVIGAPDAETNVDYEKIQFTVPKNWMGSSVPDQNNCYFFYTEHARFMLNRQPLYGADLTSDEGQQGAKQGMEEGGFNNVRKDRTVSDGNTVVYVFTGDADTGTGKINGTILYVQAGDEIYSILIAVEDGYDYGDDIETIISSIDVK